MSTTKSEFGVFGLGVMGGSISLNILDKGYYLSVYNRNNEGEEDVVEDFLKAHGDRKKLQGFTDLQEFVQSLERPRKILIMIKAGPAVDYVLEALIPLLSKGDIVIDGGNSHYLNTKKRYDLAREHGVEFVGAGISGGEEGARKGPSIMPGGDKKSYDCVAKILEDIAAKDDFGKPCCVYVGEGGAGHFIKMVHNGIEYVEMQLLSELFALLSTTMSREQIIEIFDEWNQGELSSYLLDITIKILREKEGDEFLLDLILDRAGNKGTGSWSSKAAFDLGVPNTMMSGAVFARYLSSFKKEREIYASERPTKKVEKWTPDIDLIKRAYEFARLINHQQGFKLMDVAGQTYNWGLNFSEISRIWSNGCIIKSNLMKQLFKSFQKNNDLLDVKPFYESLNKNEIDVTKLIGYGLTQRVSLHCFTASLYYWVDMTTERLPANLIQAQRDFFGAHTYQRIDAPESSYFHNFWS